MSRRHTPQLAEVLAGGGFIRSYIGDVYYGTERTLPNVGLTEVSLSWNGRQKVQGSGSCTVVWSDDFATSVSPRAIDDPLAPFGPQLFISEVITAGPFIETVPLGWFRIVSVPSARDEYTRFAGRDIVVGSLVQLTLQDEFSRLDADPFDRPTPPRSLTSVWGEAARITGMQVTMSVPDETIPRSIVHPENRLTALYDLFNLLDAVPYVTVDGTLSARPNRWPAASGTIRDGDEGTLLDVGNAMTAESVRNRVVVRSEDSQNQAILGVAEVTVGPLRVRNADGTPAPFGVRTKTVTSQLVVNRLQGNAWAARELAASAQLGMRDVPIEEVHTPLREVGDVVMLEERPGRFSAARIYEVSNSSTGMTPMKVEVSDG